MDELLYGLYITIIGVAIVFIILGILSVTVYLLKYLKPAGEKNTEAGGEAGTRVEAETKELGKSLIVEPAVDPDTLSAITAAIIGFQEVKRRRLMEIDMFRKYPQLARILPLAGIYHRASIKLSIQGAPRMVEVRETGIGSYIVVLNGKKYNVWISRR